MLSYETCLKLKEAGFYQGVTNTSKYYCIDKKYGDVDSYSVFSFNEISNFLSGRYLKIENHFVFIPTLSELIEECGYMFCNLIRVSDTEWTAHGMTKERKILIINHMPTKEEAVAALWLAINEKK